MTVTPGDIATALFATLDAAASARDVAAFSLCFADEASTLLAIEGELIEGLDAIRCMHADAWSGAVDPVFRTTLRSVVSLAEDALLATATGTSQRSSTDGLRVARDYAITALLVRRPQGWRVLQAHESLGAVPAVTHLNPALPLEPTGVP